jgi:hypothetical protein
MIKKQVTNNISIVLDNNPWLFTPLLGKKYPKMKYATKYIPKNHAINIKFALVKIVETSDFASSFKSVLSSVFLVSSFFSVSMFSTSYFLLSIYIIVNYFFYGKINNTPKVL